MKESIYAKRDMRSTYGILWTCDKKPKYYINKHIYSKLNKLEKNATGRFKNEFISFSQK